MPETSNDEILEYLIQKVEETGVSPSVTLMIGGIVVVGGLVRSKLYYDYLSGLFDTYTNNEGEILTMKGKQKDMKSYMIPRIPLDLKH
jgi:hypothetical protein